jgi:hypothetical protein
MFLRCRPALVRDLPECFPCFRDRHLFSEEDRLALLAMWRELLLNDTPITALIEDLDAPIGSRIAYVCLAAIATDDFVHDCMTALPPGISLNALRRWQEGRSPFLTRKQIAAANVGDGMCMVAFNTGLPDGVQYPEERGRAVRDKITSWIAEMLSGLRLKELQIEAYVGWQHHWCLDAGFLLRTDFPQHPDGGERIGLYGLSASEAAGKEGCPYLTCFTCASPRLRLTRSEQTLLLHALSGQEDADLAYSLCLSPNTVKKRWASILDQFSLTCPELFPELEHFPASGRRGAEKRGRILTYVRHHMEELRPYLNAAAERTG